jgi:hypothetical protein
LANRGGSQLGHPDDDDDQISTSILQYQARFNLNKRILQFLHNLRLI